MEFKLPKRFENSNKGTYGKVLNISGSDYMPGAAFLSSVSALKIGCGYCFLSSSDRVINAVAAQTQNIVFLPYTKIDEQIKNSDVVIIGCGLSVDDRAKSIFQKTIDLVDINTPIIIDADGINILSKNPDILLNRRIKKIILTPHPKEASRLLDCSIEDVLSDIKYSAKLITQKYNSITVLKTHNTYVYSPDGQEYTNSSGNNSLAKAGSGDVLTGIIAGLIAQKSDLFQAACLGVYIHGLCADIASENLTQYCVMANDIIDTIPKAIKTLIE